MYTTTDTRAQHGLFKLNILQRHTEGWPLPRPLRECVALHSIFGLLFMVMRCSEQQDKQLMLGPLGTSLLLVRSKRGSCYRQTRWNSAQRGWCHSPTFDLTIAWRLLFLTSCHQTHKLTFFKPSLPRSPFQHHLATEGGCHGNATHMSRLPSLLP